MLNFLYCFDENYTTQAYVSITSLLESTTKKINIEIISNLKLKKSDLPSYIINHEKLNEIIFHKLRMDEIKLYNLKDAHVTEATFYRLFLEDFLEMDNKYFTYLDCDIICLNDPETLINDTILKMSKEGYAVSFNPEITRDDDIDYFKNLNLKGDKYFNAGVMIANLKLWRKFNVKNNSIKLIPILAEKAIFWDQDILNVIFDNNYFGLPSELNSRNRINENKNIVFHHFSGKHKPWTIKGFDQIYSKEFHNYYSLLKSDDLYLEFKNKKNSFYSFLNLIFRNTNVPFEKKVKITLIFIKSLFFQRKTNKLK